MTHLDGYNLPHEESCGCLTCQDYLHFEAADQTKLSDFWKSPKGLTRRIDSLAQDFSYKIINNAFKIVAETNKAEWMEWEDKGDSKVCPICKKHRNGGSTQHPGYYKISWFLPKMPAHRNCRCVWRILFYDPFG